MKETWEIFMGTVFQKMYLISSTALTVRIGILNNRLASNAQTLIAPTVTRIYALSEMTTYLQTGCKQYNTLLTQE